MKWDVTGCLRAVAFGAAILPCASACGTDASTAAPDSMGTSSEAIISGTTSGSGQDAVVLIVALQGSSVAECTGTLLAPNLVLTARHCVSQLKDSTISCDQSGNDLTGDATIVSNQAPNSIGIFTSDMRPDLTRDVSPAAIGKQIFTTGSTTICGNDIALILLQNQIRNAKVATLRLDTHLSAGATITAVGWGLTAAGTLPTVRQTRANIPILRVGPKAASATEAPLPFTDFEVGEAICEGDSGGPAFATDTGALVGVVSRGGNGKASAAGSCVGAATRNDYTAVASFKSLILNAYSAAGAQPNLEVQSNTELRTLGTKCTSSADCAGSTCSGGTCALACNATAACPQGSSCDALDTGSVCTPVTPASLDTATFPNPATKSCALAAGPAGWGPTWLSLLPLGAALVLARRRFRAA